MCGHADVICTLTLRTFSWWSTLSQISLNRILWFIDSPISPNGIELFTALNSLLRVELKLRNLTEFIFYSKSGDGKLMRYLSYLCALRISVVLFLT